MLIETPPNDACTREQLDARYAAFTAAGFHFDHDAPYAAAFLHGATRVYLKKIGGISVAVHPDTPEAVLDAAARAAGSDAGDLYHNRSMNKFPKRRHTGKDQEHYGRTVDLASTAALTTFLATLVRS